MNRPDPETLRRAIRIMELRINVEKHVQSKDPLAHSLVVVGMYDLRDAVRAFMSRATLSDYLLLIPSSEHHLKALQDMQKPPVVEEGS